MNDLLTGKRKFWLTTFITVTGTLALFTGKLPSEGYITLMTLILSIYGAANVLDKKLGGAG